VDLVFADPGALKEAPEGASQCFDYSIEADSTKRTAVIRLGKTYLAALCRPDNTGECALFQAVIEGIARIGESVAAPLRDNAKEILQAVFGNPDAKMIHLVPSQCVADHPRFRRPASPRLIQDEDRSETFLGLAWCAVPVGDTRKVKGKLKCTGFCNTVVDHLWARISATLAPLSREDVVAEALLNLEAIEFDRSIWERTARAQIALRDGSNELADVVFKRELARAIASISYRSLIEMAVCAAKPQGDFPSRATIDGICGDIAALVEMASLSDAVHFGLTEPQLTITKSGGIKCADTYLQDLVMPYVKEGSVESFRSSAKSYDRFYEAGALPPKSDLVGVYGQELDRAFQCEFGIGLEEYADIFGELLDLALEEGSSVVRTTSLFVRQRLIEKREMSTTSADAFFEHFVLRPRRKWEEAPEGFTQREVYPWRFRRRLSLLMRPVVSLSGDTDSTLLYGVRLLETSIRYIVHVIKEGWLPQQSCLSSGMSEFIGALAAKRGREFQNYVASTLRELGWCTYEGVLLTELGGTAGLGDIDVLAWHPLNYVLLVVECKRLKPAKTTGEVGEQLHVFQGKKGDRLERHLNRYEWIKAHVKSLERRLGISCDSTRIAPLVVTNVRVPMRFRQKLHVNPRFFIRHDHLASELPGIVNELEGGGRE